jgi:ribosomal protein S18 acetylase RimI-like enzyme
MVAARPSRAGTDALALGAGLHVRPATEMDRPHIANVLYFEEHVHRHLDWRGPLDWLGQGSFWVLEAQGEIRAALACPPDPPHVAWVRLFTHVGGLPGPEAWARLWNAARPALEAAGGATVAAIALNAWFASILGASGFRLHQHIVLLEWKDRSPPVFRAPEAFALRRMRAADLPAVVAVDEAAFDPLWRNSLPAFHKAFGQAVYASVAENARQEIVAYQLSTGNPLGAHLARLAVRPELQGRGLGAALTADLIAHLQRRGPARLTVNTQNDNSASLALYEKLGFCRTGETFPVFVHPVGPA